MRHSAFQWENVGRNNVKCESLKFPALDEFGLDSHKLTEFQSILCGHLEIPITFEIAKAEHIPPPADGFYLCIHLEIMWDTITNLP